MAASADHFITEARRHHLAGRLAEAEALYHDALRLQPKHPDGLHYLGVLRLQLKDTDAAVKLISRAIKAQPGVAEMHMNLGAAYRRGGEPSQAVFAFRKALALQPKLTIARLQLGNALREAKDFAGAVAACESYLAEKPEDPGGYLGLAMAHFGAGHHDAAMTAFDHAITFDPEFAEAYNHIATLLGALGQTHAALAFSEKAIALAPTVPDWKIEFAVNLLRLGRLAEGWGPYEARFERETFTIFRQAAPPPYWNGEDLAGKRLRVWMEQGIGDQILFASMLPEAIARAAHCTVECEQRLAPVFARSFPNATVVGNPDLTFAAMGPEGFDYQIPAGSLGRYLRTGMSDFPKHAGYLRADETRTAEIRSRYRELARGRKVVGLSWRTVHPKHGIFEEKSTELTTFAPILKTEGCLFVNLQYGDCRAELAHVKKELGVEIFQDPAVNALTDLDGLFAQISALDLVITTSNTTAHIAGAQNKPVWVMLPYGSGLQWYWFLRRTDSPWYPSAHLIRAPDTKGQWWRKPVETAAEKLRGWQQEIEA